MFVPFEKASAEFTKSWEEAAGRWWDQTLRAPETLERMRGMLGDVCAAKERSDRALEDTWTAWRLPSAADVERLHERLGDLEDSLGRIESLLAKQAK